MGDVTAWLGSAAGVLVLGGSVSRRRRSRWRGAVRRRVVPSSTAAVGRTRGRRRAGRSGVDPVTTLPDVVDLLAVAAASGLPAGPALVAVAPRVPEPWRSAIQACLERAGRGQLVADALGHLPAVLGDAARPVVAVVRAGLADGDRLAADLGRLAADARDLRRRRAEERARRIPVRLLLPLVTCSLPAFAVLSIVPIVAGALEGLRLPSVPS